MDTISVPFAPTSYKIVAGIPLLIFSALALYWGAKNLRLCIGMLQGRVPLPPNSSPPFVMIGVALYLAALAAGAGAAFFFVALATTQPTIISQDGIQVGAAPPHYQQKFIPWSQITLVTCGLPVKNNEIRSLAFYSRDSEVELGNAGASLNGVLAIAKARAPRGTIRPCVHRALDHWWSY